MSNSAQSEFKDVICDHILSAFKKEMAEAKVDYQFVNYPGALHGFTNPDADRLGKANELAVAYNAEADKQSWDAMKQLFKDVFGD